MPAMLEVFLSILAASCCLGSDAAGRRDAGSWLSTCGRTSRGPPCPLHCITVAHRVNLAQLWANKAASAVSRCQTFTPVCGSARTRYQSRCLLVSMPCVQGLPDCPSCTHKPSEDFSISKSINWPLPSDFKAWQCSSSHHHTMIWSTPQPRYCQSML